MKLSVIVPVFRAEENALRRCFDSILNQTMRDLELLAVNDDPGDACTAEIFAEYAARDPRFVALTQPENRGVSAARNRGLTVAKGGYIGFVDADDAVLPEFYSVLLAVAEKYDCSIVSAVHYQKLAHDASPASAVFDPAAFVPARLPLAVLLDRAIWNRVYRRDVLSGVRFAENLRLFEDMVFVNAAFRGAARCAELNYPGYCYFRHAPQVRPLCGEERRERELSDLENQLAGLTALAGLRAGAPAVFRHGVAYLVLRRLLRVSLSLRKKGDPGVRAAYWTRIAGAYTESLCPCAWEEFPLLAGALDRFFHREMRGGGTLSTTLLRGALEVCAWRENLARARRKRALARTNGGFLAPR